jgi:hypothetical protein
MARWLFAFFGLVLLMSCQGRDRPVARADGVVVTERELRQALWERYGAATLQELLVWKIAKSEAQKRGITVSEAEVQNALKSRFSPTTPRHLVETELLLEKLAWAMAEVSEAEARRYFEAHREEFERPERVRLRDITLESKENAEAIYQSRCGCATERTSPTLPATFPSTPPPANMVATWALSLCEICTRSCKPSCGN